MKSEYRPPHHCSYLLTAWEERRQDADAPGIWRFGLEDVHGDGRRRVFTTLEEVMNYVTNEIESLSRS